MFLDLGACAGSGRTRSRRAWRQRLGSRLPSPTMTTTDIVTSIDRRLTAVKAEIAQLEGAREALSKGAAPAVTPTSRRRPRRTTPSRAVRAKHVVVASGQLTALLDGSGGMSTSELAKATNGNPVLILAVLRELEQADQVRRTGQRRGTRWHLISDEDRVAARAAEIAAQSKRRSRKAA